VIADDQSDARVGRQGVTQTPIVFVSKDALANVINRQHFKRRNAFHKLWVVLFPEFHRASDEGEFLVDRCGRGTLSEA
jgi:hypothetical protein